MAGIMAGEHTHTHTRTKLIVALTLGPHAILCRQRSITEVSLLLCSSYVPTFKSCNVYISVKRYRMGRWAATLRGPLRTSRLVTVILSHQSKAAADSRSQLNSSFLRSTSHSLLLYIISLSDRLDQVPHRLDRHRAWGQSGHREVGEGVCQLSSLHHPGSHDTCEGTSRYSKA